MDIEIKLSCLPWSHVIIWVLQILKILINKKLDHLRENIYVKVYTVLFTNIVTYLELITQNWQTRMRKKTHCKMCDVAEYYCSISFTFIKNLYLIYLLWSYIFEATHSARSTTRSWHSPKFLWIRALFKVLRILYLVILK